MFMLFCCDCYPCPGPDCDGGGGGVVHASLALTEHGDLPLMYLYGTKLVGANATVTFGEVVKGTGTWDECNRRGVCGTLNGDVCPGCLAASVYRSEYAFAHRVPLVSLSQIGRAASAGVRISTARVTVSATTAPQATVATLLACGYPFPIPDVAPAGYD